MTGLMLKDMYSLRTYFLKQLAHDDCAVLGQSPWA